MPEETTAGTAGPPAFPGPAPPQPPPPQPPPAPPSYPVDTGGVYPPPQGRFPPPSYGAPPGAPYASWGARLGGWLIDAVIFAAVEGILNALLRHTNALSMHFTVTMHDGTVRHDQVSFLAIGLSTLLGIAYATILCGGARGQTVGMMAVGVRVVRHDTQGPLGYGTAFGRSLFEQVLRFTVVIWVIDVLFPLWDGKRQTLHDKAVGTVVLRIRNTG